MPGKRLRYTYQSKATLLKSIINSYTNLGDCLKLKLVEFQMNHISIPTPHQPPIPTTNFPTKVEDGVSKAYRVFCSSSYDYVVLPFHCTSLWYSFIFLFSFFMFLVHYNY